ncbi:MAG: CRISPR-associated endoribonuclease Cas6, partial [Tissierellia bacterium]|nr:CRISPR-associated endoribonuclease Cas6 [Tissierellia bacterium]
GGYWKGNINFSTYEKRLIDNSIKKAKAILGEDFSEDFLLYNYIKVLNNKPILSRFKNISLLGDKIELNIADNERAQQIAYILLGTGILENNSRGYGFVNYSSGD